jgi:hypothetical protein
MEYEEQEKETTDFTDYTDNFYKETKKPGNNSSYSPSFLIKTCINLCPSVFICGCISILSRTVKGDKLHLKRDKKAQNSVPLD